MKKRPHFYFNPRAPCGARREAWTISRGQKHFNPRAPCGARPYAFLNGVYDLVISIHAPLAGRDQHGRCARKKSRHFNPRAPCGARRCTFLQMCDIIDFNPRAPCGARLSRGFSISYSPLFQSTRPLRGATLELFPVHRRLHISIHAPLAGRDSKSVQIALHIFAITDKF